MKFNYVEGELQKMNRLFRNIEKTFGVAILLLTLPFAAMGETVRFASSENLKGLDPIFTTSATTISHGYLVYDTLFAVNSKFEPQPQMVDKWTATNDGMKYTFTIRKGMKWHDGSPVEASDIVASLKRWGMISGEAKAMISRLSSITVKDNLTFEMVFSEKFGPVLLTMANPVIPGFMMRAEEAATPPDKQVENIIGSGPFRFLKDEWQPGSKIVYEKFSDYIPRSEPADGYAGGKVAKVDRVEWNIIPDKNTSVQALIAGEIDAIENVPADLAPMLRSHDDITVKVTNPLGVLGHLRVNTLHAPFDKPEGRQALLYLIDQDAYNTASVGNDPDLKKTCYAIFGCGSLFETDVGAAPFKKVDPKKAMALLKSAGYDGRNIVILDPTDWDEGHNYALILGQSLREAGANVDVQAMDWSTLSERRTSKLAPSDNSHWDVFPTTWPTITMSNPISNIPLASSCEDDTSTWYGWPCDEEIERLRAAFIQAGNVEEQKQITRDLQKRYYEYVPYVNAGQFVTINAWRKDLKDVIPFMQLVFWNIEK